MNFFFLENKFTTIKRTHILIWYISYICSYIYVSLQIIINIHALYSSFLLPSPKTIMLWALKLFYTSQMLLTSNWKCYTSFHWIVNWINFDMRWICLYAFILLFEVSLLWFVTYLVSRVIRKLQIQIYILKENWRVIGDDI